MGPDRASRFPHSQFEKGGVRAVPDEASARRFLSRLSPPLTAGSGVAIRSLALGPVEGRALITKEQAVARIERAWATLKLAPAADTKTERVIRGTASTPSTDRMGDIVEPMGLEFKNPLPLIWQHRHEQPVGLVTLDPPTEKGVTFSAVFAAAEPGSPLAVDIDKAYQAVRLGLVRGVSIGFRALELNFMEDGGIRYVRSEIVELSLVTVPANADATISQIKSLDAVSSAASGQKSEARKMPGVSGPKTEQPEKRKDSKMPTQIAEQISGYEAQRTTAQDRMNALMGSAAEDGRTLDEEEAKEYDSLESQSKQISEHVIRLQRLAEQQKSAAAPVVGTSVDAAAASRSRSSVISVKPNVPLGTAFARYCIALAAGNGRRMEALEFAKSRKDWQSSTPEVVQLFEDQNAHYAMRAAVPAGTTYDSAWAGALVVAQNTVSEFAEYLRPLTIIGRIPGLRRVPFNISIPRATSGTTAGWVGEAAPKPITSMAFDSITLRWAKAAGISVLTEELVRFSNPAAEEVVRSDLARGIVQFLDRQFVDPNVAAVTNVSPASITNGITPIAPTGVNMAAMRADTRALFQSLLLANQPLASGVWIMTQQQAVALSLAQNSLGQVIFPGISAQGGTFLGYPIITSENLPASGGSPADGYPIIFCVADEILLADDGQVVVDVSREASLNMDSAPDSPPTASTNMISLWQLNQVGIRAERWITWARRRSTAVAWIGPGAHYAE
jgi:HK97 family phage major capsid protein/HK97 family phage prohead protease